MSEVVQPESGGSSAPAQASAASVDSMGSSQRSVGAERAKLSPLQAPAGGAGVRGSSRTASDAADVLWGAAMGALWADAVSQ